jgi:hypothetical protein
MRAALGVTATQPQVTEEGGSGEVGRVGAIGDLDGPLCVLEGELLKRCSKSPGLQRVLVELRLLDG